LKSRLLTKRVWMMCWGTYRLLLITTCVSLCAFPVSLEPRDFCNPGGFWRSMLRSCQPGACDMVWMSGGLLLFHCLPASHRKPKRVRAVIVLCSPNILCCAFFHDAGRHTPSFLGRHQENCHELTARINLLPVKQPDASLERNINEIEQKRTRDEGKVFKQVSVHIAFVSNWNRQTNARAGGF
jgi:hypothetical protein